VKVIELGNLLGVGIPSVDGSTAAPVREGDWVGFAIGPDSLVDLVRIDGCVLGPNRVLPATSRRPTIEAVRGCATGGGLSRPQVNGRCQLIGYECGDPLVPPGPRVPFVMPTFKQVRTADIAPRETMVRLPFSGRKFAQFCITVENGGGLTYTAYVRGLRYFSRAHAQQRFVDEPFEAVLSTLVLTATSDPFTGIIGSNIFYEGGTDSAEGYDELVLEMESTVGAATPTITIGAEVWDFEGGP
jgi:hypothetical protein